MTTSGNSDDKILLFSNTEPLITEPQSDVLLKKYAQREKKISDKEKKLINKAKYFTEDNNRDV